ncbi:hypothetical protein LX64_00845 [Chitinophaga skermanii]|uniref:Uncharacterized protein n=1 Tax=Chitinophaga skermanii TaxID=331697 RepID=A0A327QWD1_9BACT|nr:hypothetical protein LX64_00845 [Chitinophaga skermanii]
MQLGKLLDRTALKQLFGGQLTGKPCEMAVVWDCAQCPPECTCDDDDSADASYLCYARL